MRIAALDIGGTAIKHGIWDGSRLIDCEESPSAAREGGSVVLKQAVEILRAMQPFDAIGISTSGEVDVRTGAICSANENIPHFSGTEIGTVLHDAFGVPVAVENDANAAALGELAYGAMRGERDFLYVTYGTGVGGAIVTNGEIYRGNVFSAGSFGGIVVHPECLSSDDLLAGRYERYASTGALVRSAQHVAPHLSDGRAIFAAENDPAVQEIVRGWVHEVALGLITLVYAFSPPCLVLGGGVMQQPGLVESIAAEVRRFTEPRFTSVRLVKSELGNNAGVMGGAHLAQQLVQTEVSAGAADSNHS